MGDLIFYLCATDFQMYITSSDLASALFFGTFFNVNLQDLRFNNTPNNSPYSMVPKEIADTIEIG